VEITPGIRKTGGRFSSGVALLMSMSVILLLSIALMKTFEQRSLEIAQLGHNLDRFQAENLSRSGLKLILFTIKRVGLVTVATYLEQLRQIEFPVGNGSMKIVAISPVDHRFNLNKKISQETDPRVMVFRNMVAYSKSSANEYNYLSSENANEALSAIIDWTDKNSNMDSVFRYVSESYPHEKPEFSVKNREFDLLSEVRLLPPFRKLELRQDFLEANFRVTDDSGSEEFVDVNLTPIEDIERFLGYFDGVSGFLKVSARREEILRIIADARTALSLPDNSGFAAVQAPFPVEAFKRTWTDRLVAEGIELDEKEKNLFKPLSKYLFIHYQVTAGRVTLNVRTMIEIEYIDPEKKADIKTLTVLWYRMT